jgi:DNA-binding FadR family transcriptional regulator
VIEVRLAALAAERATPEQIEALERATDRMEAAAANPYDYPEADVEFHLALAEAAGNRYLLQAMNDIRTLLKQDMELGAEAAIRRFGDLRMSVESHRRLLHAVAARDSDRAAEIADEIVSRNQMFVLGLYALAPSDDGAGTP